MHPIHAKPNVAPTSLEQIEAQMMRQRISPNLPIQQPQPYMGTMSLEQVEAQMRSTGHYQPPQSQWNPGYGEQYRPPLGFPAPILPQQIPKPVISQGPTPVIVNGKRFNPLQLSSNDKMSVFDIVICP
jgi:hypothetical protein